MWRGRAGDNSEASWLLDNGPLLDFAGDAFLARMVGSKPGAAGDVVWVVPVDLGCEQPVGLRPASDRLHDEEGGKTFLPEAELTLDLAFRLGIFANPMADAEATAATLRPALMGLCPKPRSLSNRGEWLQGKRPFPRARFLSWEPIAPSGLLGLLSSRALSVLAVSRTGNNGCEDARGIGDSVRSFTFAQLATVNC